MYCWFVTSGGSKWFSVVELSTTVIDVAFVPSRPCCREGNKKDHLTISLTTMCIYNVKMLFIGEAAQIFHSTDKTVMKASRRGAYPYFATYVT